MYTSTIEVYISYLRNKLSGNNTEIKYILPSHIPSYLSCTQVKI